MRLNSKLKEWEIVTSVKLRIRFNQEDQKDIKAQMIVTIMKKIIKL